MIRRPKTIAAVGIAGLLALAACGTDDAKPVVKAEAPAPQSPTAYDVYYDLTHPDAVQPRPRAPESANQLEHRFEANRPRAPESVNQLEHRELESIRQRVRVQRLVAKYAESQYLTGLSPAFLQPAPVPRDPSLPMVSGLA